MFLLFSVIPAQTAGGAQDPSTVLVLVNDSWPVEAGTGAQGAGVYVGEHYAQLRNIPPGNVLHLAIPLSKMHYGTTRDFISYADFDTFIQQPLKAYLENNNLKDKILYIVPTYGIPYMMDSMPGDSSKTWRVSLDSVLAGMYSGYTGIWGVNPYHTLSSTDYPAHFKDWVNPLNWKMYLVTRLDGPTALIAAGLADKAVSAETSLQKNGGSGYYDWQHRSGHDAYKQVDDTMLAAYNESVAAGIPSVLNDQSVTGAMFSPASTYGFTGSSMTIFAQGISTVTMRFAFPAASAGRFEAALDVRSHTAGAGQSWYRLYSTDRLSYWELFYPFPGWSYQKVTLKKVVNGTIAGSCSITVSTMPVADDLIFTFSDTQGEVFKNGVSLCNFTDSKANHLDVSQAELVFRDMSLSLTGLHLRDSGDLPIWDDSFATDSTGLYSWLTMPKQAPNALFIWGWYSGVNDAYTVVNGAVGTQMTSYTANYIRSMGIPNQDGQWVPYFLRLGITATWGATGEPYTTGYAEGDNLLGHFWHGYNFAESAYLANPNLNWMMVFVGDPLYAPAVFSSTDFTPPNPPGGVTFSTPAYNALWLSWTASTGSETAQGYLVDVSTSSAFETYAPGDQNLDVEDSTGTLIAGLQASTTYYARVRAYNVTRTVSNNSLTAEGLTLPPPVLSVNPSSMSFSGTAGGADPGNQSLQIQNIGTSTMNWVAAWNASWLSLSGGGSSGGGSLGNGGSLGAGKSQSVEVSVNLTGLAAGVYQDTITVTAPGAAGSPAFVPVTLTVSPAGSTGGGPLPELSLKGLDGMIYRLDEEIVFSYPVKGVTFQWSFTATASLTPAVRNASGSTLSLQGRGSKGEGWSTSSPSATTQAPRFTPTSLGLGPGTYQLTVIASRLGSESRSATARISLTASDLAGVKVYPNPWRSDKHAAHPTITFAGLTVGTTIKLFTASAHEVKELHTDGPTIAWDLTNDAGDKVASGIYMYLITDRQGDKVRGKLAVIK